MNLPGFIGAIAGSVFNTLKRIASKTYEDAKDNLKQELRTKLKDLLSDDTYVDEPFSDNECNKAADKIATFLENTKIENLESRKNFMEYLQKNRQELADILNGNKSDRFVTKEKNSPIFNDVQGSVSDNIIGDNSGNTTYSNNGDVYQAPVYCSNVYNGVDNEKK